MARQQWIGGAIGKSSREEAIVRLCKQATQLDPDYAQAWALMALAQLELTITRTGATTILFRRPNGRSTINPGWRRAIASRRDSSRRGPR